MSSLAFIDLLNHLLVSIWCHRFLLYVTVQNYVIYCFAQFIVSSLAISVGSYVLLTSLLIVGGGCLFENFLPSWYRVLQTHLVYFLPQFIFYIHRGTFNVSID